MNRCRCLTVGQFRAELARFPDDTPLLAVRADHYNSYAEDAFSVELRHVRPGSIVRRIVRPGEGDRAACVIYGRLP